MTRLLAAILSLAAAIPALSEDLKGEAARKFLDSLAIPDQTVTGRAAIDAVAKAQIPIARDEAIDLYSFGSVLFTIERGAPFYDKIMGKYAAASKPDEVCLDFQGKARTLCGVPSYRNGLFAFAVGQGSMSGPAVFGDGAPVGAKTKFDPGVGEQIHAQRECRLFREIVSVAKSGSFRSVMTKTEPDGNEWYENGEPFFDAELDANPYSRPCIVNEGQNFLFCQVATQIGKTEGHADIVQRAYVRKLSDCLGVEPTGPSPITSDNLRFGTMFEVTPRLQAYVMKGARSAITSERISEQLFLVSFNIGNPPPKPK
jgi:hypothetical protein